ncbi:TetR/AcrR family transcriptional regulator [Streptomyces indicus]|uniref:DNA-binding transcriptional regulator, AcrR family n=1 Tax=Streptomyces indicus TaxID=417292 RepID=A0A1G9J4Q5_9ACTN|nr:TetR/AcrR family transcriptional regulator [Streptomyces indicus]SDL32275.1 DNA-binding transcriptional regulator, AcrR family [Streptomyces indicus]
MPGQEQPSGGPGARRRQARGERRAAQLLDAAAVVFARSGYAGAGTNAIAREAGVSPGTLYQFFANKEAIAIKLGDRLLEQWRTSYGQALSSAHLGLPLAGLLDAVVDPLLDFNARNPAFHVLVHGADSPGHVTDAFEHFHGVVLGRIEEILALHLPGAARAEVTRVATTVLALFTAGLDLIAAHPGEQDVYRAELKKVLLRYLEPVLGARPPARAGRARRPGA